MPYEKPTMRLSWLTLTLTVIAAAIHFVIPDLAWLQYDRTLVLDGQWWRILSGHFVHWSSDHLLWDLMMFAALGCWIESTSRWRLVVLILSATTAISACLLLGDPSCETYRGLSGLDSALFTCVIAHSLHEALARRDCGMTALMTLALLGFLGKSAFEVATGHCLFVDDTTSGFTPLPKVHMIGACIGLSVVIVDWLRRTELRWPGDTLDAAPLMQPRVTPLRDVAVATSKSPAIETASPSIRQACRR
jgi:rhomboid family GlyGly-CTERM serine protease